MKHPVVVGCCWGNTSEFRHVRRFSDLHQHMVFIVVSDLGLWDWLGAMGSIRQNTNMMEPCFFLSAQRSNTGNLELAQSSACLRHIVLHNFFPLPELAVALRTPRLHLCSFDGPDIFDHTHVDCPNTSNTSKPP